MDESGVFKEYGLTSLPVNFICINPYYVGIIILNMLLLWVQMNIRNYVTNLHRKGGKRIDYNREFKY